MAKTVKDNAFTGRSRKRSTSKRVLLADVMARGIISSGGIGTILAVLGVCVFLLWVVVPLFIPSKIEKPESYEAGWLQSRVLHTIVDDYETMGVSVTSDGMVRLFRLDNGSVLDETSLIESGRLASASFRFGHESMVLGGEDGSLSFGELGFGVKFLPGDEIPRETVDELFAREAGYPASFKNGIVQRTPENQYRYQSFESRVIARAQVSEAPIRLVRHVVRSKSAVICFLSGEPGVPVLSMITVDEAEDFMSGETTFKFGEAVRLPLPEGEPVEPAFLAISGTGKDVYAAWRDGRVIRIRCNDAKQAFIAERGRLTEEGVELTAMEFVIGDSTLVWGDSRGSVRGGFCVRLGEDFDASRRLPDLWTDSRSQFGFLISKDFLQTGSPLRCLRSSGRTRLMLCGFDNGEICAVNITSESTLARTRVPGGNPVFNIALAPRENGFMALAPGAIHYYDFDPRYPEATLASLFLPIWYEEYAEPLHMWQSSSASDDFEPKMGLTPLIFGTLKATLYAMLFGVPLALLAAIFSSEFLHFKAKAVVKPLLEMMASLPSVVLGFLGALVFAPFVEEYLSSAMLFVPAILFSCLFGAYIWQLVPGSLTRRLSHWRLLFVVVPLAIGVVLAALAGPVMEKYLFAGSIMNWLSWDPLSNYAAGSQEFKSTTGGWLILLYPVSILLVTVMVSRFVTPVIRKKTVGLNTLTVAVLEMVKFLGSAAVVVGLAWGAGSILNAAGVDPRVDWTFLGTDWSPMDTYVQRNALIVGVVMGFAVIPIIYTISDDALAAVPDHLRSASLGSGATVWQTTVRIVIPTAMSGLFSAVMIGLGRAVGETMIVLMALGNTPLMDWNIFNGARTLSANIAVELPEAVRNSAHYRTLFLAALVLFIMTFILNTVAEAVRLKFRKKAVQL